MWLLLTPALSLAAAPVHASHHGVRDGEDIVWTSLYDAIQYSLERVRDRAGRKALVVHGSDQVCREHEATLQDRDHEQLFGPPRCDLAGEFVEAGRDLFCGEDDLDIVGRFGLWHILVRIL